MSASSDELRDAKRRLRAEARARRDALEAKARAAASGEIARRVAELPAFRTARRVALYADFGSEVATGALEEAARQAGKATCYPRVEGEELVFVEAVRTALTPGAFGILAPAGLALDPASIDLFLVPGLAFDPRRHRLGYGKGFYDRALARAPGASSVGLAFEAQILGAVPAGPDDIALSLVVTEARIL